MLIKPHAGQPAKIKVVGIGGGGGNALTTMIREEDIVGVEFIAMNTDAQALLNHDSDIKIQIGENLTKGLGSGGDPEIGRQAAEESREKIREQIDGADMVFIAAGLGGGTGTGASPVVADVGKEVGALTVAVVTRPFVFEGARRKVAANEGVDNLKGKVDTLIVIPNQKVLEIIDSKVSILEAFKKVDSVLHQGVKGIAELITVPGLINVDFADVKSIMNEAGSALMGIGIASGENRTTNAVKQAIQSPLLESNIAGAKGVLFNIVGGPDLSMSEIDEAASHISKTVDPDADIIFGAVIDEKMMDQVRVTVIATKIDGNKYRIPRLKKEKEDFNPFSGDDNEEDDDFPISDKKTFLRKKDDKKEDRGVVESDALGGDEKQDDEEEFDVPTFLRKRN